MKKYYACAVLLINQLCVSDLHAEGRISNFFRWFFPKSQVVQAEEQHDHVSEEYVDDKEVVESGIEIEDDEEEPEELIQEYRPRLRTVSEAEAEWVIEALWNMDVPIDEYEYFLDALEAISQQEFGIHKIFRCKRNSMKQNYNRIIRKWDGHEDATFAQQVQDLLSDMYLKAFLA